jgi:hypothetical protein
VLSGVGPNIHAPAVNTFTFNGRIGRRWLGTGSYVLVLTTPSGSRLTANFKLT